MRRLAVVSLTALLACGDNESPPDAGSAPDKGVIADAGPSFACGPSACAQNTEYCLEIPTAPCVSRDGGGCAATEERCVASGVVGCTAPIGRRCEPLPSACGPPLPCACLPDLAPCGGPGATCFRPADGGPTVTCAFP